MKWPAINQLSEMAPLPDAFRYDWLKHSEIPTLTACIERWHPDIAVGCGSCYLRGGLVQGAEHELQQKLHLHHRDIFARVGFRLNHSYGSNGSC